MNKYAISMIKALNKDVCKPPRIKTPRDRHYLSGKAQGLFSGTRQAVMFYNPSDEQLDAIFSGTLWGYR